jgi:hypothetical protein
MLVLPSRLTSERVGEQAHEATAVLEVFVRETSHINCEHLLHVEQLDDNMLPATQPSQW